MKMDFYPEETDNFHIINKQTDSGFLFLIQRAVLLGLKEKGALTGIQHRLAEEMLLQQYRDDFSSSSETG